MAISDNQKVDYLWKKLGYAAAKTDINENKLGPNEAIPSPLLLRGDNVWAESEDIPTVQPTSSAGVVTVYPTSAPRECTMDNTATTNRTWKTSLTDWIPPEFGSTYQVKVYIHTSSDAANAAASGTQVFATGSGNDDEWFFDYQAGVLHFIGTSLPNGVSFTGKSVYVAGSRYTGDKGVSLTGDFIFEGNRISVDPDDIIIFDSAKGLVIPTGTSVERPEDVPMGTLRFNTNNSSHEYWDGTEWVMINDPLAGFAVQEIVGDGTTTDFLLDAEVVNASTIMVTIGGVVQTPGVAYTLVGLDTIRFVEAPIDTDEVSVRFFGSTRNVYISALLSPSFTAEATLSDENFNVSIDSNTVLTVTGTQATLSGDFLPGITETYDLGSSTYKWKDLHLSGSSIYLGNLILQDNGDGTLGVYNVSDLSEATLTITSEDAQKWTTARTITLDGAVTGSVSIDGSSNVTLTTTLNLTGAPTAPTAAAGTNTTQIATTAFVTTAVDNAVTNLLDDAPGVLDTLNELAAAIGDDANFITTINDNIDTKLSLSGGTMTGSIDMSSNSLTGLPAPVSSTDAANKTYVDSMVSSAITSGEIVLGEGTSGDFVSQITAGEGIDVSGTSGVSAEVVISAEDASATNKGIASFDVTDFVVNSGAVTLSEERIQDIVGAMVTGNATEGVITTYDDLNQKINLSVTDFNITLTGDVTGTALVTTFGNDITINTTTESILGITVQDDFVDVGDSGTVDTLSFNGNNIELTRTGNTIAVSVAEGLTELDVRDTIGSTIKGTIRDPDTEVETESGITVNYDSENNTVELGVREFDITLVGDITGSGTVSRLQDVTITTTADFIAGITVQDDSVDLGSAGTVNTLSFDGSNIVTTRVGNTVNISVPTGLTAEDVRDEIGSTLRGTIRDGSTEVTTESGITVNYDVENDIVELGVREFDINLSGAITGSATVTKLQDVTIFTESNAIEGLTITKNSTAVGSSEQIKSLNFVGSNLEVGVNNLDSTVLDVTVTGVVDENSVVDIMKPKLAGSHDGLTVSYDNYDRTFDLAIDPITINLSGAVTGTGTVTFDGSGTDSAVNINTSLGGGTAEIGISDEYETQGTVSSINFVGGGITTAVSLDGTTATVYVPNSPANEPFLTVEAGSENVPNARRLVAGTGISITDGGAGRTVTISAASDAILAKSQIAQDDTLIGQQIELNFKGSRFVQPVIEDDGDNDRINITIYDIKEYWFRSDFDCGSLTDDEGAILNMGDNLKKGIFETKPDLGSIA
jgi:hypothetical protein